jgi:hypothetical protein
MGLPPDTSAVLIPHSSVIMVRRERLGEISEMPLLPPRGWSVSGMYLCIFNMVSYGL